MNTRILLCLMVALGSVPGLAQTPPTLPNTADVETCFPDTSGYAVITVGPAGRDFSDLQAALHAAAPGSILVLDAGAAFKGSFTLPNKTGNGWIILMSSHTHLLPQAATRIAPDAPTGNGAFPTQKDAMPKIVTTNPSGLPCLRTQASAHHYRFVGLELTVDTSVVNSYGLVFLGDASAAQNTLSKVPHDLVVDRCYIHGHDKATVMKAGILLNSANTAIVDSYLSDFHSIGFDTYAIGGTNGPGPFKILNNYLEAAGENILFGGGAPAIPNLVPADIEVRLNHFFKPFSWRVGHPDYAGKHWTIKNLFELKTGKRVLLDANLLENCWADLPTGQSGYAILLTVRAEGGGAPQADVSDITITNNVIRHVGAGITLSGHDSPTPSLQSKRIRIANNLFDDINGPNFGDGNIFGPNDGTFLKIGDPADVVVEHNTVFQTGPITWAYDTTLSIAITDNIFNCFLSAGGYQGVYGPGFAQGGNGPMGAYFPGITDANRKFHKNVLIGGNAARYSNYATASQNFFPNTNAGVQFVNYANGINNYRDYALAGISPYKHAASDGSDIGVDFVRLDSAWLARETCDPTVSVSAEPDRPEIRLYPNPFRDHLAVAGPVPLEDAVLVLFSATGQEVRRFSKLNGLAVVVAAGDLPPGIYFAALWQAEQVLTRRVVAVAK